MLLTLASNRYSRIFISKKSKNNIKNNYNNNNNNNCLTSMTCLCGRISCCHSKLRTITTRTAASVAVTSLTTSSSSSSTSANNIISSSTKTKEETTMKTSALAPTTSTKDNSNYMHCANSTFNKHTCYNYSSSSNNSDNNKNASCINSNRARSNSSCTTRNSNSLRKCIFSINNNFSSLVKFVIVLIFFTCCDVSQAALRDVNLYIEPPAVRRSQSVTLHCHYQLEGAPLYSVKFYRGQLEFFRYTPGEYPNTKVFHYPGIKVDESESNATQVVIRNVNFGLSGTFSCEVTADAPLFSTATAYAQMQVVEFPDKRPQLLTELTRYEPGDILRANCSTPPSRPKTELNFSINNIPVSSEETQYIRTVDNLIASRLSLKVQLQAAHFVATANGNSNLHMINGGVGSSGNPSATGGPLLLRCTAQIGDLYQEYKEIELGTPLKDPVPARVTSSGGGFQGFLDTYFGPTSAATAYNLKQIHSCLTFSILMAVLNFYRTR